MSRIPARLRRLVIDRAGNRCEYCGLLEAFSPVVPLHVEPEPTAELSLVADPLVELKPQPMLQD